MWLMEMIINIFQNGINYVNYGKANFAREIMRYKEVRHAARRFWHTWYIIK